MSSRRKLQPFVIVFIAAALVSGIVFTFIAGPRSDQVTTSTVTTSSRPETGKAVYARHCASCHGAKGQGDPDWKIQKPDKTYPPPPHDSTGHTWHHSDGLLYRIVSEGGRFLEDSGFKSAMPAFRDELDPADIRAVIEYLKTLWGPEEKASQARSSESDPYPSEK